MQAVGDGTSTMLMASEAEMIVQALSTFDLTEIGSEKWHRQHEHIEKLNIQAVMSASANEDEFVKEFLITYEKIPVIIHELIVTELWKKNIFTELVEMKIEPKSSFPLYMILYHEATLINLLETVMFHKDSCEAAEDSILDLVDYCHRKLLTLTMRDSDDDDESNDQNSNDTSENTMEELCLQNKTLEFNINVKVISILRYISDHLNGLPLSTMSRLLNTHDTPVLLVQLVENPPWTRRKGGKIYKYINNKWEELSFEDSLKITKTEGQIWLALYHLLMDQDCQQKYEFNSHRKNSVLKLRSYLSEVLLDQLPVLGEMLRYLEQLSMMEPPAPKRDLVLEQVPEIHDTIVSKYNGKWKKLAKAHAKSVLNPPSSVMKDQAKRIADMYNFDALESLILEPPKCAVCGAEATKRCSRCQNEWYCRRECQVGHWPKHKKVCDLMVDSLAKIKDEGQKS